MSEPEARPAAPPRGSGRLWGVLAGFLVLGALGLATIVYGLQAFAASASVGTLATSLGAVAAFLAFLFTAGLLYRVDRGRGANRRKVALFE